MQLRRDGSLTENEPKQAVIYNIRHTGPDIPLTIREVNGNWEYELPPGRVLDPSQCMCEICRSGRSASQISPDGETE